MCGGVLYWNIELCIACFFRLKMPEKDTDVGKN